MQSGVSTPVPGITGTICAGRTNSVMEMVNCTAQNSGMGLECLRAVPLNILPAVVSQFELSINDNALPIWKPVAPSSFVPEATSTLLQTGRFAKDVDIINGGIKNDGSLFIKPIIAIDAEVIKSIAYPAALLKALLKGYFLNLRFPSNTRRNRATTVSRRNFSAPARWSR